MDDMKTTVAAHRNDAALHLENAARLHRDAARQCEFGNFEKAHQLATEAAETDTAVNTGATTAAMQARDLYLLPAEQEAARKAEAAAGNAARAPKKAAKAS